MLGNGFNAEWGVAHADEEGRAGAGRAGGKERQIGRKAKHEAAIEAYGKRVAQIEVELEVRTGHAGRAARWRETP